MTITLPPAWTLLVDGRSGAGKSQLTSHLTEQMAKLGSEPQIVRLDDCYPGWSGLEAAVDNVTRTLLRPRASHGTARWQRYDWGANRFAEWHDIDNDQPLIVEGCGILTRETATYADWRIWMDGPPGLRQQRAFQRDGDAFRPYWDMWAAQEAHHIARNRPMELADQTITI